MKLPWVKKERELESQWNMLRKVAPKALCAVLCFYQGVNHTEMYQRWESYWIALSAQMWGIFWHHVLIRVRDCMSINTTLDEFWMSVPFSLWKALLILVLLQFWHTEHKLECQTLHNLQAKPTSGSVSGQQTLAESRLLSSCSLVFKVHHRYRPQTFPPSAARVCPVHSVRKKRWSWC